LKWGLKRVGGKVIRGIRLGETLGGGDHGRRKEREEGAG
jgi:hypothetical protein